MQAYHNDVKIKEKYVKRMKSHKAADRLVQGTGWDGSKGCAIGCTLENYNHSQYPIELGVPLYLAYLEDKIFEGLPKVQAMEWPQRFLEAIPVGADLELILPKFTLWVLQDVLKHAKQEDTKKSILKVTELYDRWASGTKPTDQEFLEARKYSYKIYADASAAAADASAAATATTATTAAAADASAAAAADASAATTAAAAADAAAATTAAASAAADAAAAAAAAAASAAASAAAAADARHRCGKKAWDQFWITAADKLIELLEGRGQYVNNLRHL